MLKIAIVHDWLNGMRGGEILLEEILNIFPTADLFTMFYCPERISMNINRFPIKSTRFQKLPGFLKKRYRYFLPLYPNIISDLDLKGYDVIFSVSHCLAKGVRKRKNQIHICYCNSPMRYLYDQFDVYFRDSEGKLKLSGIVLKLMKNYLKKWDFQTAQKENVDYFIANSKNIAKRIEKYWKRDSDVVYPFVDDEFYTPEANNIDKKGDFFLVVSALVPYKRIDIAVKAFSKINEKLIIVGEGTEWKHLTRLSQGNQNVKFTGRISNEDLREHYRNCKALIFPGEEDFGIVPLEAMACGKPVIAFGKGGALETVREEITGRFFKEPNPDALIELLTKFRQDEYKPEDCREQARQFSRKVFSQNIKKIWSEKVDLGKIK